MLKNWTRFCALKHASYVHSLHASYSLLFIDIFCALTLSNIVYHWFLCFSCFFFFPFDDIMSLLTGTSISWGTDPRVTTHELTELHYLFFRISCHNFWPISHVHTIPIERCAFLYALIIDTSISFPTFFIHSLVEVHRSSAKSHGSFFPVFIHRILLDLGLEDFPTSKPVHIIAPIGATFLRQRAF